VKSSTDGTPWLSRSFDATQSVQDAAKTLSISAISGSLRCSNAVRVPYLAQPATISYNRIVLLNCGGS